MALAILQTLFIGLVIGFLIGRILAKIEIAALSCVTERKRYKKIILEEGRKQLNLKLKLKYKVPSSYLTVPT